MKLKQFIYKQDIKEMIDECLPFLTEMKKIGKPLYRGTHDTIIGLLLKKSTHVETGRKTMNMEKKIHNYLNKLFVQEFGWPARNGVMACGSQKEAASYGNRIGYYFFPCGEYEFVWSPKIDDLFLETPSAHSRDWMEDCQDLVDTFRDTHLESAIQSTNEISFNCKNYYIVHPDRITFEEILNAI